MYVRPIKRKKISLWLLILIILFIVAIVFTIIHMSNSSKANSDSRYSKKNSDNVINRESSGSTIGRVDSYDSFSDISVVPGNTGNVEMYNEIPDNNSGTSPTNVSVPGIVLPSSPGAEISSTPITFNNHTYSFQELGEFGLKGTSPNEYVELTKGDILYKIQTDSLSFNDTLGKEGLKEYLENTYKVTITSELKTGTVNNIQMIICSIADGSSVGYLIITPLNDSEILSLKVFDANNQFALIQDLSQPVNDIDSIKTNIQ